ncbi:hypothetical protein GE061_011105, partial [Apolygus lucorum]
NTPEASSASSGKPPGPSTLLEFFDWMDEQKSRSQAAPNGVASAGPMGAVATAIKAKKNSLIETEVP